MITSLDELNFRFATKEDIDLYYRWANDELVRFNSFNQNKLIYADHVRWFESKLKSDNSFLYLFLNKAQEIVGQIRIDDGTNETVIGISIDEKYRGKSLGIEMLNKATIDYLKRRPFSIIVAYIKLQNISSYKIFKKAGFSDEEIVLKNGIKSYKLFKKQNQ